VAIVPAVVKQLVKAGCRVLVEGGAGMSSYISDQAFTEAGATIATDSEWTNADAVLVLRPPAPEKLSRMKRGAVLIGMLQPQANGDAALGNWRRRA